MKQLLKYCVFLTLFFLLTICPAMAADMDHSSHGSDMNTSHGHGTDVMDEMGDADAMGNPMDSMGTLNHTQRKGKMIRETTVDGFHLMYHLIDMQEQMEKMKAAGHTPPMNNTHHLMVYIMDVDGNAQTDAKVGYLIQTTKDKNQKTMTMAMAGGFGADVDLSSSETYTIKTKIVIGKKTFMDKFDYTRH